MAASRGIVALALDVGGAASSRSAVSSRDLAPHCDVETSGTICLGSQRQVLLPPALPAGIVGFWSFDGSRPVDMSGHGNHGAGPVQAGPALGGQGNSAFFSRTFLEIPDGGSLGLKDFSYTFWLFLVKDRTADANQAVPVGKRLCTLVRKGTDGISGSVTGRRGAAPAVLYHRPTRRIQLELTTTTPDDGEGGGALEAPEIFRSHSRLRAGRWYHVAVVRLDAERKTRLYVNGILDTTHGTDGFVQANNGPLHVGGEPWPENQCGAPLYIDELKVYNRPVSPDEIQAEAAPSLSGVEPSFVRLGCVNCTLESAIASCPSGYKVCSALDMHTGGYQVARGLGWLEDHTHVWTHADTATSFGKNLGGSNSTSAGLLAPAAEPGSHEHGLGICCADF